MNYFAHGLDYLDDAYFLAGTAIPDWLSVVNRRSRARRRRVTPFLRSDDPHVVQVAAGILQHLEDDRWFHQTRAFVETSLQLTVLIRDQLPADDGFRPSFLGHILVEILLDAQLIEAAPEQLDRYYATLESLDPVRIGHVVQPMVTQPADLLPPFISRFLAARFLYDYLDDEKLLWRLNHVMRRVGLAPLPPHFLTILVEARSCIRQRSHELLDGGSGSLQAAGLPGEEQ